MAFRSLTPVTDGALRTSRGPAAIENQVRNLIRESEKGSAIIKRVLAKGKVIPEKGAYKQAAAKRRTPGRFLSAKERKWVEMRVAAVPGPVNRHSMRLRFQRQVLRSKLRRFDTALSKMPKTAADLRKEALTDAKSLRKLLGELFGRKP